MSQENPFNYTMPVSPVNLVGRWNLIHEICADLSNQGNANSWAIIGGRRFGKSSLLQAIAAHLTEQNSKLDVGNVFPIVINLARCTNKTKEDIFFCILKEIQSTLEKDLSLADCISSSHLTGLTPSSMSEYDYHKFEKVLVDMVRRLENIFGLVRMVLLLDEVENIVDSNWSEELFNQLRSLITDSCLKKIVKLVLTGSTRVVNLRQACSPLFNSVILRYLESIPSTDIEELIARAGAVPMTAREAIQQQCGGHPFIAQFLLHYLWKQDPSKATSVQISRLARAMRQERSGDFYGWWNAISESGRLAYPLLIEAQDWINERSLLTRIRNHTPPLDQGLSALCYHGLIVRNADGDQYRMAGTLFRDWFLERFASNPIASYKPQDQPWYKPIPRDEPRSEQDVQFHNIDVVILTAVKRERDAVLRLLEPLQGERCVWRIVKDGHTYYLGRFGVHNAILSMCHMGYAGPGGAILTTSKAIGGWQPKAVIMAGIAFGRDPDKQKMADVLVSSKVICYGNQAIRPDGRVEHRGDVSPAGLKLLDRFRNTQHWHFKKPDGSECEVIEGSILSGEILSNNLDLKTSLFKTFPTAIGGEMEAAGVYAASYEANTQWIVVKAICDWGDGSKTDNHQDLAAAAAASLIHHILLDPFAFSDIAETSDLHEPDFLAEFILNKRTNAPTYSRTQSGWSIRLFVINAPLDTISVTYKLSSSFIDRKRIVKYGIPRFEEDLYSWGNCDIRVIIQKPKNTISFTRSLCEALERGHTNNMTEKIRKAINDLKNH